MTMRMQISTTAGELARESVDVVVSRGTAAAAG